MEDVNEAPVEHLVAADEGIERVGDVYSVRLLFRASVLPDGDIPDNAAYSLVSGVFSGAEPARSAPTCAAVKKDFQTSSPVSSAQSCRALT